MVDVLIITFNESLNLPYCLESLSGWTRKVFVVDSGSTDGTQEIAEAHGAEVVHHDWPGYAAQRNWALQNLPLEADWTLILDADEIITPELRTEIEAIAAKDANAVTENGFFINRLTYFLGKPIRHCGYFPSWNLRLFKRGLARYEHREVHEHMIIDDPVGFIGRPMLHRDRRGLEHFYAKHNRYSTLEAREVYRDIKGLRREKEEANLTPETRRRRWLKRHVTSFMPFPALWRFLYMYVFRLGIFDGWNGYRFCLFIANYDGMVAFKLRALLHESKHESDHAAVLGTDENGRPHDGLAAAEGDAQVMPDEAIPPQSGPSAPQAAADADAAAGAAPTGEAAATQMQPESSPWSFGGKVGRALWMLVGKPLFRFSFHNWYTYRNVLLRLFGATIGKGVAIRPTVNIEVPWTLDIHDGAVVGDHAILYSLGRITIGERAIISQYAHLCAGTHDYMDHTFKLLRTPITICPDAWVGADSFVGPGVTVGRLTVIGARSSVYKDMPPQMVCIGNPAKPIKERVLH